MRVLRCSTPRRPCMAARRSCNLRRERALRLLCQRRKTRRVVHGDVRQHLAVEGDAGLQQAVHETAVAHAVDAGSRIDAGDPQRTEIALLLLATDVGVLQCLRDRLLGDAEDLATGVVVALGLLQDFLVTATRRNTTLNSCHFSVSSEIRKHAVQTARVLGTNVVRLPEVALPLGRLLGEDVALVGVAALVLAGSGLPEALGRRPIGLDLGHWGSPCEICHWPGRWPKPRFPSCPCRS